MEQSPLFVGFVFLILGGVGVVRTDLVMQFQIWSNRVIMGAQYVPSRRTYAIVRGFGILFVLFGLTVIVFAR